jgi:hypothetical protein
MCENGPVLCGLGKKKKKKKKKKEQISNWSWKTILTVFFFLSKNFIQTVLLDVVWFQNLRSDCERVRFCHASCEGTFGEGGCAVLPTTDRFVRSRKKKTP